VTDRDDNEAAGASRAPADGALVTPAGTPPDSSARPGLLASLKDVAAHASSLVRLQKELAQSELQRKGVTVGVGAALAIAACVLLFFAVAFGLATIAAALALVVDWWLALLIVFAALLLLAVGLVLIARSLVQKGMPLAPEQAIEEARLTRQVLRGPRAG
jgi:Putative Actinobacterial Holin-X, holin superfamily III